MQTIKLFGMCRSGTNASGRFIEANWPGVRVVHSEGRWKHATPAITGHDGYVICIKNPYAWVVSMRRYMFALRLEVVDGYRVEGPDSRHIWTPNIRPLIDAWVDYYNTALEFAGSPAVWIPHKRLLFNPDQVADTISTGFNLPSVSTPIVESRQMGRGNDHESDRFPIREKRLFARQVYAQNGYLEALPQRDQEVVASRLLYCNPRLYQLFGDELDGASSRSADHAAAERSAETLGQ